MTNTYKTIELAPGVALEMIHIPGGSFIMGSPLEELDSFEDERPQHQVTVAEFWMGKYPITQAQYQAIIGDNPSYFKGDNHPVEEVSWFDAMKFCNRLSKTLGQTYTLPSEAQWEYACRAGTTTPFYFGETITPNIANYLSNGTTEVGSFLPNGFGLYDMHGNVWEWCLDHFHENYNGAPADGRAWVVGGDSSLRMLRGGSWLYISSHCRCAYRNYIGFPDSRNSYKGFRVVCPAQQSWV